MKSKKDISESIRENAHKLEERPSKDAWTRLESRLDQQEQPKRPLFGRRLLSIAAASIVLVCCAAAISFMFKNNQTNTMATYDRAEAPVEFVVEELNTPDGVEQGFYKIVEFQNKHQDRLSNPIIEGSGKKLSVSKSRREFGVSGSYSVGYANGIENSSQSKTLQDLNWIVGKWKGKNEVIEHWRKSNSKTLEGTGYVMADGKPTSTEVMKIQEVGGNLYFIADPTGTGVMIRYALIVNDGQHLVFENTAMTYPHQIIIQKNDKNQLGIYYKNTDSRRPGTAQINHLEKRNDQMQGGRYGRILMKSK